jgi:Predicted metal-dependent hydrolase
MFPEGERFFMDTVRHFQDRITDPKLREDVRGFLGQEGIHGREHRRYNDMLAAQGYPAEAIEGFVRLGMIAWLFPSMPITSYTLTGSVTPLICTGPNPRNWKYPSTSFCVCSLTTIDPGVARLPTSITS